MAVTLNLSDEALDRLRAEADRRGLTLDELVAALAAALPFDGPASKGGPSFIGLGSSTSGRSAADSDEMLAEGFGRDWVVLTVDTGVLLAAADNADPAHQVCAGLVAAEAGGLVASPLVIAETAYLVGRQLGGLAEAVFTRAVANGEIVMETLTSGDLHRTAALVEQYVDLRLGATDASVIALAERHGQGRIATLDRRHFSVVRNVSGESFELVP